MTGSRSSLAAHSNASVGGKIRCLREAFLSSGRAALAPVAAFLVFSQALPASPIDFGMVGLTRGQTMRLSECRAALKGLNSVHKNSRCILNHCPFVALGGSTILAY